MFTRWTRCPLRRAAYQAKIFSCVASPFRSEKLNRSGINMELLERVCRFSCRCWPPDGIEFFSLLIKCAFLRHLRRRRLVQNLFTLWELRKKNTRRGHNRARRSLTQKIYGEKKTLKSRFENMRLEAECSTSAETDGNASVEQTSSFELDCGLFYSFP